MNVKDHNVYFYEAQQFRQPWILAILLFTVLLFAYALFKQIILGVPWGPNPMSDTGLIITSLTVFATMAWVYEMRLVTEVRDEGLLVHFILLARRRFIPFAQLRSYRVRTYNPIAEYGGWGLRYGANGKAYNVSGNRGVQLELAGGERLLIGSQRPEELVSAIETATKFKNNQSAPGNWQS